MQTVDEPTGLDCYKLKIEAVDNDLVKVSIIGPRGGEHAFVMLPTKDLKNAVNKELES